MVRNIFIFIFWVIFAGALISAGIGIRSDAGAIMLNEGEEGCVSVGAYNPFSTDTNVVIGVSDELKSVLTLQDAETKLIPANTPSSNVVPIKFCFKVPVVYERDYAIAGKFIDKLDCSEEKKSYRGEVFIKSIPLESVMGGIGGSTTEISVSTPLEVNIRCNPYSWDYSLAYIVAGVLSAGAIAFILFRRYRKPKEQRIKEKMAKLKEEMKKSRK